MTFLGRPRTPRPSSAHETDRFSLAAMFVFAALCLVAGILPGLFIDALAPVVQTLVGERMPVQSGDRSGSRSCRSPKAAAPITACSSSCSSPFRARLRPSPSTASPRDTLRRAPAWDCGYPDPSPATQYTAGSFAQPIRRVFGTSVFRARENVEMPPPGDIAPGAARRSSCATSIWDALYAPVAGGVAFAADRLNRLQFLTIRRYLSLVFFALVLLLLVLAAMAMISELALQGAQMLLVLLLGAAVDRLCAQGEGAAPASPRPASHPALPRPHAAHAQGGRACGKRLVAVPRRRRI